MNMNIEYHKWYSPSLNRDMELKVYGHFGKPVIIFPCQGGRFFESEDFGMIDTLSEFINSGKIKVYTVDGIDNEAWANFSAHPFDRGINHQKYENYINNEVLYFIREHCNNEDIKPLLTGFSMGAYHAANFFFKFPDKFDSVISISGLYDLKYFVGDYVDDNVYFNSPLMYLKSLNDPWYFEKYNQSKIIFCCGQGAWEEEMISDTMELEGILEEKNIPAWIDIWGHDVNHDWLWWKKMLPYHLSKLV